MCAADERPESRRGRVLIVEDDLATLYALRTLFMSRDWEVSLSKSVATALTLLEPPPDWIVLDLGLADGDGEEVLRFVRERSIPSRVAVVSAVLDPDRIESLKRLKPDIVLPKPVSFDSLDAICGGDPLPPPSATLLDRVALNLADRSSFPALRLNPGFSG